MAAIYIGDWYGIPKRLGTSDLRLQGIYTLYADMGNASGARYLMLRQYDDPYTGAWSESGYGLTLPKEGHTMSDVEALFPINIAIQIDSGTVKNITLVNMPAFVTITETADEFQIRLKETYSTATYWLTVPANQEFAIKTTVTIRNGTSSAVTYPTVTQTGHGPYYNAFYGTPDPHVYPVVYPVRPRIIRTQKPIKGTGNYFADMTILDSQGNPLTIVNTSAWYDEHTPLDEASRNVEWFYAVIESKVPVPPQYTFELLTIQLWQYYRNYNDFSPSALPISVISRVYSIDWGNGGNIDSTLYPDSVAFTLDKRVFVDGTDYTQQLPAMAQLLPVNGKSKFIYTVTADYKYGAAFRSLEVKTTIGDTVTTQTLNTNVVEIVFDYGSDFETSTVSFEFSITDSRGATATSTASDSTTVRKYRDPEILSATVKRCRRESASYYPEDENGDYCRISFSLSYWDYESLTEEPDRSNRKRCRVLKPGGEYQDLTFNESTVSRSVLCPADPTKSFDIAVMVGDDFHITDDSSLSGIQYITELLRLDTELVTMDYTHSGVENGLGFGKRAEQVNRLDIRSDWTLKLWELQLVDAQTKQTTYLTNWMRSIESQLTSLEGRS